MSLTAATPLYLSSLFFYLIFLATVTTASTDTFIYGGCSQLKYAPESLYQNSINSLFTSLINSAMFSNYNNFTVSTPPSTSQNTISGLFQCRGDLKNIECAHCVADSVSQLGLLCRNSAGGSLQLEGCFIRYDNASFLGVEDKTAVLKKCEPPINGGGLASDELTRRDAVLAYLAGGGGFYRVGDSGSQHGIAQCVGDLSASECQDCLSDAIGRLRNECAGSSWGDVFLAKCYARFSDAGGQLRSDSEASNNDDEVEKTLAILVGLIAGVFLIIVFLSFLRKMCEKKDGK